MKDRTKILNFEVIHFPETREGETREVILIYGLGEDGIVYEMAGGRWAGFPVGQKEFMRDPFPPKAD